MNRTDIRSASSTVEPGVRLSSTSTNIGAPEFDPRIQNPTPRYADQSCGTHVDPSVVKLSITTAHDDVSKPPRQRVIALRRTRTTGIRHPLERRHVARTLRREPPHRRHRRRIPSTSSASKILDGIGQHADRAGRRGIVVAHGDGRRGSADRGAGRAGERDGERAVAVDGLVRRRRDDDLRVAHTGGGT